jgi:secreted trypsin-like serine protease
MNIALVSTFVTMSSGLDNYSKHFVKYGWNSETYEIKLVILILFILVMMIVVNNALIGLAVGDTDEVMKSAKIDKFKQRVRIIKLINLIN